MLRFVFVGKQEKSESRNLYIFKYWLLLNYGQIRTKSKALGSDKKYEIQKKWIHSYRNYFYQKLNYENDQEKFIHAPLNLYLEYWLKNYLEKLIYAPLNLYQACRLEPKL